MTVKLHKLKAAILFIANCPDVRDLGRTKLNKLLYFADAAHLRETGESITGSEYIKYDHGPVPSRQDKAMKALREDEAVTEQTEDLVNDMVRYRITARVEPPEGVLTSEEEATLAAVCKELGRRTATELSDISHKEPAYIYAEEMGKLSCELMLYGKNADPDGL